MLCMCIVFQLMLYGECYCLVVCIDVEDNGLGIFFYLQDILFYLMVSGCEGGIGFGLFIVCNFID